MNARSIIKVLNYFRLGIEKEDFDTVHGNIQKGIEFKSTNLWILIFAIFIASLGLNVNSTAVIIGAMLISPLMGPIMGMGFGMAINDLIMLKKALFNYLFAAGVALLTSTFYFLITPIDDAHSEILARTSPNIYDVLIALFGGLAGSLAASSRLKGNIIPGVAIATALMPPLCTAGYGLATWQLKFFFGAFYLFFINTVFIALATLITTRVLKFPYLAFPDTHQQKRTQRIVSMIVLVTLLPSLYLGYNLVQENKFIRNANKFIDIECIIPNDYLLQKNIDSKQKQITLVYGGMPISESKINEMKSRLNLYDLKNVSLNIQQGFASVQESDQSEKGRLNQLLMTQQEEIRILKGKIDSSNLQEQQVSQLYQEMKILYPALMSLSVQKTKNIADSTAGYIWLGHMRFLEQLQAEEEHKIRLWLSKRVNADTVYLTVTH